MRARALRVDATWPVRLHLGAALVITLATATTVSQAHDLLPPPFRGGPGTTFQAWGFNTPLLGAPDGECTTNNPFGSPSASGVGNQWMDFFPPTLPNFQGIQCLPLGSVLIFDIPNIADPILTKTIWVQIVFHPHLGSNLEVTVNDAGGNAAGPTGTQDLPVPGHPTWIHRTLTFCFANGCPPNVDVTLLSLIDNVDIDQVIIDTACAPKCLPPAPPAVPNDYDGDGIPDDEDNAPGVANPNQVDCDCDGFGNVSDLWGICVPGTPPELEPCGFDFNGGCNSVPSAFETIACGDTVCGTAWADGGLRDTDWFEITLPDVDGDGVAKLRAEICTALPVVCIILSDDCANLVPLAVAEANPDLVGCVTACLPAPATYLIFVAPGTLAGGIFTGFPCDIANEYSLSVDCFEPCTSGGVCGCLWDLDDSGDVGIVDFLAVLAAWGPNPGDPADFDCDSNVGILDFLELLANWGTCP